VKSREKGEISQLFSLFLAYISSFKLKKFHAGFLMNIVHYGMQSYATRIKVAGTGPGTGGL
jgi:hypothetical protein